MSICGAPNPQMSICLAPNPQMSICGSFRYSITGRQNEDKSLSFDGTFMHTKGINTVFPQLDALHILDASAHFDEG